MLISLQRPYIILQEKLLASTVDLVVRVRVRLGARVRKRLGVRVRIRGRERLEL